MALTSAHLTLLVEVGRTGSLSRTAMNLRVTAPAISQQLARLEKEVGVPLVERGARGARLTPLGERLAAHGSRVAEELGSAEEAAAEFIGLHRKRLRIGAPTSICMALLPDVLTAIRYQFPESQISVHDVSSAEGIELIGSGELDFAVVAGYGQAPPCDRVTMHRLMTDPLMVVLPDDHPRAGDGPGPIDIADLAHETWVSGPPRGASRRQLDDIAAEHGFVPYVPFHTESYDVAQALVASGSAIALVPAMALADLHTVARPLATAMTREVLAVLPSSDSHVPMAREFLERLKQAVGDYADEDAGLARSARAG